MYPKTFAALMLKVGLLGTGWFRMLEASRRIWSDFDSEMRKLLRMLASKSHDPGFSIVCRPMFPRVPGCGFCSTTAFDESVTACSVQNVRNDAATALHCGSVIFWNVPLPK